jgi:NTP pyrophosphatase (non-canonical NTP hydrolase)
MIMNARIQQLMDRAFTDEQGERFDPELFAQLIVQECVDIAELGRADAVATVIKERFGLLL